MLRVLDWVKRSSRNRLDTLKWLAVAVPVVAGTNTLAADDAAPDNWNKWAEVYLWGASVGGNTAGGGDIDVPFGDLLEDLEMGFMGAFGANKGKWGFIADVLYLDVDSKSQNTRSIGGLATQIDADTELKGWVIHAVGGYNLLRTDRHELDAIAGVRYLDLETDIRLTINGEDRPPRSVSGDAWDAIIGLRGKANFSEKWYLSYQFDMGTGDTDFTWQGLAAVGYRFKKVDGLFAYRYIDWNFDADDPGGDALDDLNFHGPFAGVKFSW